MSDASYIFGGDTGLSYEEVQRRRAVAERLASRMSGAPKSVGEGLSFLGAAIGSRIANKRAEKADEAMREQEMDLLNSFFGGGGASGGGGTSIYGGGSSASGGSSYVAPAEVPDPNPGFGAVDQFGMEGDAEIAFPGMTAPDPSRPPSVFNAPQEGLGVEMASGGTQDFMMPQQFEPLPINGALNGVDPSLAEMAAQAWGYAVPGGNINVTTGVSNHSPINHAPGHAIDFQVTRPDGSVVRASDPEMLQAAQIGRALGVHGIGYGEGPTGNYMGGVHTHWDISRNGPRTWGDDDGGTSDRYGAGSAEHAAAIAAASGRPVDEVLAELGIEPGDPEALSFGPTAERDFMLADLQPSGELETTMSASVPADGMVPYRDAIAAVESRGSGDYAAVGPVTRNGNRAYGRYQVMDFNIGPWTEQILGQRMTPQEFLADPAAQDAVFDGIFGGYVEEYGNPQDAASVWFSGRPLSGNTSSDGYIDVPEYVERFNAALGEAPASAPVVSARDPAPVRVADAGTATGVATDARDPRARLAQIVPLLQSPRPGVRAIAQVLVQREMQQMFPEPVDPMDALDLEYRQLQIDQMRREMEASPERERIQDADGRWRYVDDQSYVFPDFMPAPPDDPADVRSIQWRAEQAGLQPGTPEYRQFVLTGGSGPLVDFSGANIGGTGTDFGQDYFEDRYAELQTQSASANQMLGMYDIAEQALASGLRTGFGAEAEQSLRRIGQAMGMDVDTDALAGGELLTSVTNRMALQMRNPDSGMGMPGAVSDRDLTFLKDAQIGIDRSPLGNARMLRAFRALEERKVELARMADQYIMQNGRLDIGFNEMVREYAEANPLFSEEMFSGIQAPATTSPADAPPPADATSGSPLQMNRETFLADPNVKSQAERFGTTPEAMWEILEAQRDAEAQ